VRGGAHDPREKGRPGLSTAKKRGKERLAVGKGAER